ncbi:MAG: PilZ domain-containing protein [Deltaproteobacteria bacterium]|nr:PilZ domain-containing protein [Deltaproteobacteria bacterium]
MSQGSERRQHDRLPKSYTVEVREFIFPISRQPKVTMTCVDISSGGLAVLSPKRFEPGEKLQVKISIPRLNKYHSGFFKVFESDVGQYLQAVAQVAWTVEKVPFTSYSMGLEFLDVYEDDWKALSSLIKKTIRDQR